MLKMMTFNHIKHKPIGSNASPLFKNLGSIPTCTTEEDDVQEVVDCSISGMPSSMASLLPRVNGTGR